MNAISEGRSRSRNISHETQQYPPSRSGFVINIKTLSRVGSDVPLKCTNVLTILKINVLRVKRNNLQYYVPRTPETVSIWMSTDSFFYDARAATVMKSSLPSGLKTQSSRSLQTEVFEISTDRTKVV